MKNVNPVNWFDISVSDLARSKKFYETVFDITLVDFPIEWGKQAAFPADHGGLNATGAMVHSNLGRFLSVFHERIEGNPI